MKRRGERSSECRVYSKEEGYIQTFLTKHVRKIIEKVSYCIRNRKEKVIRSKEVKLSC